ncbi:unnamed protein product [Camellia sinensis]
MNMTWLSQTYGNLPIDADDITVQRYARAFILQLLDGSIFAGKSGSMVQLMFLPLLEDFDIVGEYSWGSATLAWLYQELCCASRKRMHDISGFLILVQIWAWYRFPYIAPRRLLRQPIADVGGMHLLFERFPFMSFVNIIIPWIGKPVHRWCGDLTVLSWLRGFHHIVWMVHIYGKQ